MANITNVVVARYNKNVDFAYKINDGKNINVIIYDKENPTNPYNIPVNKGNEASAFLKYVIDFYNELPEFTFFIHDEDYAWHHSGSVCEKYKEAVVSNKKYYNINDRCANTMNQVVNCCNDNDWIEDFLMWYEEYIEQFYPIDELDYDKSHRNSAQFLVHRDYIRKIPKAWYEKCYSWIITTSWENGKSGRFLEWTWHILWELYPAL